MNTNNTPYTPKPEIPEMQPQPGTMPEMPTQQPEMQPEQPGTMPEMPGMPEMPRRRAPKNWQERFLSGNTGRPLTLLQERKLPNWLFGKSLIFFFVAFALCTFVFGYPMELELAIISSLSVVLFFYGAKTASQKWAMKKERAFVKDVFFLGLAVRLLWVLYCYFFFNPEYWGSPFGDGADTGWYMDFGEAIAEWIKGDSLISFHELIDEWGADIDDTGYPFWLAIVNIITFGESTIFVPFVLKCLASAYCAVCIYHIAKRHFGDSVARLAALFVALNPNMIYWCGTMFKESEMVFLCCLCVDLVDKTFTSGNKLTFRSLLPGILVGFALFFFRAALATVVFLAMGAHIVMVTNKVMSTSKKIIAGVMVAVTLFIGIGDSILSQTEKMVDATQSDDQKVNMEWRSTRKDGANSFAKYAGAAVFAPLIFTIPFPSFNIALESQILQRQLSGGSYIKNIFSFFVIWVMLTLLISGEWRKHVFILAYTLGYLASLVLSKFAQSGRFHMPIWPFLMLFAALGIQMAKTTPKMRKWFTISLVIEVAACLAWNWFKLKGRGMI